MKLKQTRKYDMFKSLKGNRAVNENHVKQLQVSIRKHGFQVPILVSKNDYLIDGQHRLEAAKKEDAEVLYLQTDYSVEDNSNASELLCDLQGSRKWTLIDYIEFYCSNGIKDYILFRDYFKMNDITYSVGTGLVSAIKNNGSNRLTGQHGGFTSQYLKEGNLIFNQESVDKINPTIMKLNELLTIDESYKKFAKNEGFKKALLWIISKKWYEHDRMVAMLRRDPYITKSNNIQGYLAQTQDKYNCNSKGGARRMFEYGRVA